MKTLISAIGIAALSLSLGWQVNASAEDILTIDEDIVVDEAADTEQLGDFIYDDASGYVEEEEGVSGEEGNSDESDGNTGECTEDCDDDDGYTGSDD